MKKVIFLIILISVFKITYSKSFYEKMNDAQTQLQTVRSLIDLGINLINNINTGIQNSRQQMDKLQNTGEQIKTNIASFSKYNEDIKSKVIQTDIYKFLSNILKF